MSLRAVPLAVCLIVSAVVLAQSVSTVSDATLVASIDAASQPGARWPLFIHAGGETWHQPLAVYPAALLRKVGVPRDVALLLPSLMAAWAVVWGTFVLGSMMATARWFAPLATTLLLLTPGLVSHARTAGSDLLLAACLLWWCVAVLHYVTARRGSSLGAGALLLAVSAYAHPAGFLSIAVFVMLALLVFRRAGIPARAMVAPIVVIAAALVPIAAWIAQHPAAYPDTLGRWVIHAAHVRNPVDGVIAFTRWHVAARRVSDYWNYFSPTFLFGATRLVGLWISVLVVLGVAVSVIRPLTPSARLLIGAALSAPAAVVLLDVPRTGAFVLLLVPLAALFAAIGADEVVSRWARRPGSARGSGKNSLTLN